MRNYAEMPLELQVPVLETEQQNYHLRTAKGKMWTRALEEFNQADRIIGQESDKLEPEWKDDNGTTFVAKARNTQRVVRRWVHNIEQAKPAEKLDRISVLVADALALAKANQDAFNKYMALSGGMALNEGYTKDQLEAPFRAPSGKIMNEIAALYEQTAAAVKTAASGGDYQGLDDNPYPQQAAGGGGGGFPAGGMPGGGVPAGGGGVGGAPVGGIPGGAGGIDPNTGLPPGGLGGLPPTGAGGLPQPNPVNLDPTGIDPGGVGGGGAGIGPVGAGGGGAGIDPTGAGANPELSGGLGGAPITAPPGLSGGPGGLGGGLPTGTGGLGGPSPILTPPIGGGGTGTRPIGGGTGPGGGGGGGGTGIGPIPGGGGIGPITGGGTGGGTGNSGLGGLGPIGGGPGGAGVKLPGVSLGGGGIGGGGIGGIGGGTGGSGTIPAAAAPFQGPATAGPSGAAATTPPSLAATAGASSTGAGAGGVPPMMPPMGMGGAGAGAGNGPGSGAASRPGGNNKNRRKDVVTPGLPVMLSGKAGMADMNAFTGRGRKQVAESDVPTTVQLIDEDLWQVEQKQVDEPVVAPVRRAH